MDKDKQLELLKQLIGELCEELDDAISFMEVFEEHGEEDRVSRKRELLEQVGKALDVK